jgi:hypothetical protein
MRRMLWCAAALAALAAGGSAARGEEAVWSLAGKQVLRLHGTAGGLTPMQRVERLDERVTEILSSGDGTLGAADIVLKQEKGIVCITVRGRLLVTVTAEDAAANHTTKEKLGHIWLSNLRKTLPLLAPRENKRGA